MKRDADRWPTEAELLLWRYLRVMQLKGLSFRRQERIGNYIVDFVCHEKRLVVEVDSTPSGTGNEIERKRRDNWLRSKGFNVLKFKPKDVLSDISGVLEAVWEKTSEPLPASAPHMNVVDGTDREAVKRWTKEPGSVPEPANAVPHLKYK